MMPQRAKEIHINNTMQVKEPFLVLAETAADQIRVSRSIQLSDSDSSFSSQVPDVKRSCQLTADRQTDGSTCEEDEMPLLCVLSLEFDQTLQVRGLTGLGVTLMVGEELHQVLLLVGREEVQEPHGVGAQSSEGQQEINIVSGNIMLGASKCNVLIILVKAKYGHVKILIRVVRLCLISHLIFRDICRVQTTGKSVLNQISSIRLDCSHRFKQTGPHSSLVSCRVRSQPIGMSESNLK